MDVRLLCRIRDVEELIYSLPFEVGCFIAPPGKVIYRESSASPDHIRHDLGRLRALAAAGVLSSAVYTHNHPNGFGFSLKDIEFALSWRVSEFRAVGPSFVHRLGCPPGRCWPSADAVEAAWNVAEEKAYEELAAQLAAGAVSEHEADTEYWHRVCLYALPAVGLMYQREVRTK